MTEREALTALRGDDIAQAARAAQILWQMWHRSGDPRLVRREDHRAARPLREPLDHAGPPEGQGRRVAPHLARV